MDATASRRRRLVELDAQLSELALEKIELQKRLEDLKTRQRALEAEKAHLSPLYTLPEDVLVQILEDLYLHDFPFCSADNNVGTSSPMTISHVSRRLRDVALSLPSIWRCVHITLDQPALYHEILRLYIHRSTPLRLSVVFVAMTGIGDIDSHLPWNTFKESSDGRHISSCLELICDYSHRWRHLAFMYNYPELLDLLLDSALLLHEVPFPHLTFLCAHISTNTGYAPSSLPPEYFPALTHLHCYNTIVSLSSGMLAHVTELSLTELDLDGSSLAMLAKAAPHLSTLSLAFIFNYDGPTTYVPATFPCLRFLSLWDIIDRGAVMSAIIAPRLHTFICATDEPLSHIEGQDSLVTPLYPQLQELTCVVPATGEVEKLFKALPSVASLDLLYTKPDILALLNNSANGDVALLPRLVHLTVFPLTGQDARIVCDPLLRLSTWRKERKSPLEKISIALEGSPVHYISSPDLQAIEALGVSVEIIPRTRLNASYWHAEPPDFDPRIVMRPQIQ